MNDLLSRDGRGGGDEIIFVVKPLGSCYNPHHSNSLKNSIHVKYCNHLAWYFIHHFCNLYANYIDLIHFSFILMISWFVIKYKNLCKFLIITRLNQGTLLNPLKQCNLNIKKEGISTEFMLKSFLYVKINIFIQKPHGTIASLKKN